MPLIIRVKRSVWEKVQEIWDRAQYLKQEGLATQAELDYLHKVVWELQTDQIMQLYQFIVSLTDQLKQHRAGLLDAIIWPSLLPRGSLTLPLYRADFQARKNRIERGEYEIKPDL
jgi:hypothetical protein